MKIINYKGFRNDLYAKFKCKCPSELFKDDPTIAPIIKQTITLIGYNDDYFFDVVNAEPRIYTCKCGRKYKYQWKRSGVEVEEIEQN